MAAAVSAAPSTAPAGPTTGAASAPGTGGAASGGAAATAAGAPPKRKRAEAAPNDRRTVYLMGLPRDVTHRELQNMFFFWPGFLKVQLYDSAASGHAADGAAAGGAAAPGSGGSGNGKDAAGEHKRNSSILSIGSLAAAANEGDRMGAFVLFDTPACAGSARELLQGYVFDRAMDPPAVLNARFARKNLVLTRDEQAQQMHQHHQHMQHQMQQAQAAHQQQQQQAAAQQQQAMMAAAASASGLQLQQSSLLQPMMVSAGVAQPILQPLAVSVTQPQPQAQPQAAQVPSQSATATQQLPTQVMGQPHNQGLVQAPLSGNGLLSASARNGLDPISVAQQQHSKRIRSSSSDIPGFIAMGSPPGSAEYSAPPTPTGTGPIGFTPSGYQPFSPALAAHMHAAQTSAFGQSGAYPLQGMHMAASTVQQQYAVQGLQQPGAGAQQHSSAHPPQHPQTHAHAHTHAHGQQHAQQTHQHVAATHAAYQPQHPQPYYSHVGAAGGSRSVMSSLPIAVPGAGAAGGAALPPSQWPSGGIGPMGAVIKSKSRSGNNPPGTTLFLGNLNNVTDDDLLSIVKAMAGYREHKFSQDVRQQRVAFVEFETIEHATEAMRALQGHAGMHIAYSKNPLNRRTR